MALGYASQRVVHQSVGTPIRICDPPCKNSASGYHGMEPSRIRDVKRLAILVDREVGIAVGRIGYPSGVLGIPRAVPYGRICQSCSATARVDGDLRQRDL